ncbi:MAG TPA: DALR domain-containing protein, partial [Candidatus Babeliaceae bacterium]|nr:DALR domain-containing protein [Candidatus Babeliaceae bacterium]
HVQPAKYWIHNNMITINGKKMGKSYNNVIKLTELFSGNHPLLTQAFKPMVIRFFILQTHYRSTLDFSNEALVAAERGLKRLWDAYEILRKMDEGSFGTPADAALDLKINSLINELGEFMNDDFNTAKVLASMFEIVPVINSLKDGNIKPGALSSSTLRRMKDSFKIYIEDILGLTNSSQNNETLEGVMQLIADIRREAKSRKDFQTSDKIRKQLGELGIEMKDEKDGSISWSVN